MAPSRGRGNTAEIKTRIHARFTHRGGFSLRKEISKEREMIYFKSIETIISEPQLMEMEKSYRYLFKSYKNFLLKHNVATPEEQYMSILIEELNEPVLFGVMLNFLITKTFA